MEDERDIRICPSCEKEVDRKDMFATHDCHGIYMRLVCSKCYERIMLRGNCFDGEYYDESMEQIEADY